tara:strand:+ start:53 stop:469 length:417 start_codon:yes stop_codon:yes gene_type:complete
MKKLNISESGKAVFNRRILNEKTHKLNANLSLDHVKATTTGVYIIDIMNVNKPSARFKAGDTVKFTWPDYDEAPLFTGKVTDKPVPDSTKLLPLFKGHKPKLFITNKEKWFYLDGVKVPQLDTSDRQYYAVDANGKYL